MYWKPSNNSFECFKEINKSNEINQQHVANLLAEHRRYEEVLDSEVHTFFGRTYCSSIWDSDIKVAYSLARNYLMRLEHSSLIGNATDHDSDFTEIRKQICGLLTSTNDYRNRYKNETSFNLVIQLARNFLKSTKRLQDLPDYIIFNATSLSDNQVQNASYNLFHLYLDIHWIIFSAEHELESDTTNRLEIFERNVKRLLSGLIHISLKKFDKINICPDPFKQTPFLCPCIKEMWLLINCRVQKLYSGGFCNDFWYYFNDAINSVFDERKENKFALRCVWILYHVATIQGYDSTGHFFGPENYNVVSNYVLLDRCIKNISSGVEHLKEDLFCTFLHLVISLHIEWWTKNNSLDLIHTLWEYFYKQLNDLESHHQDNCRIGDVIKSYNFIASTSDILNYDIHSGNSTLSSYELFLCLLNKHLTCTPNHWQRLKGRIYSKLPVQKLSSFSEKGLYNLVQLFFVVAHSVSFTELTDRFLSLLIQLPQKRTECSPVVWSAHMSLIRMRCLRGMSLQDSVGGSSLDVCEPILLLVQEASKDRSRGIYMNIFIEELENILKEDPDLRCDQHMLFNEWIGRYMNWCSSNEMCNLLELLLNLIEKVQLIDERKNWYVMFERYLIPTLRTISQNHDSPYQVADLAAALVSLNKEQFKKVLEFMTSENVNVNLSGRFIKSFVEPYKFDLKSLAQYESILLKAWVRIAMLSTVKADVMDITCLLSQLPTWPDQIGSFDINGSEDPLLAVLKIAGGRLASCKSMVQISDQKKWFEFYFGEMDKWVSSILSTTERGENTHLVMKLYTMAALMFCHCSTGLYLKNTNTCLLHRLTSIMLLTSSVLTNKKPPPLILSALRKTWHLFFKGFCQLNYTSDVYAQRTMKDMVVRYVPFMYDSASPIIKCLENDFSDEATTFVLTQISSTFLKSGAKRTQENVTQAVKLVLEMFRFQSCSETKTQILIKTLLADLLDLLLHTDDINLKQLIYQILHNTKNLQNVEIKDAIAIFIEKNLAFHSSLTFSLLEKLSQTIPEHISKCLDHLEQTVNKIEKMRAVGVDHNLRKGLANVRKCFDMT